MTQSKAFSKRIGVVTTGGTIEKSYDEIEGRLAISEFLIQKYAFDRLRLPYTQLEITTLMAKDSFDIDEQDRKKILGAVQNHLKKGLSVLVIHGTDTMEETARFCLKNHPEPKAAVVFTGGMKPIGFVDSDSMQNISEALLACKFLAPGYYISFHNHIFNAAEATKLKEQKTFGFL